MRVFRGEVGRRGGWGGGTAAHVRLLQGGNVSKVIT